MVSLLLSLGVGIAFGVTTRALKLPLPAPNALPGILAVVGVYLGGLIKW